MQDADDEPLRPRTRLVHQHSLCRCSDQYNGADNLADLSMAATDGDDMSEPTTETLYRKIVMPDGEVVYEEAMTVPVMSPEVATAWMQLFFAFGPGCPFMKGK